MPDSISILILSSVFSRLQRLSIPLIDDPNTIIEKLLDHWESNPPENSSNIPHEMLPHRGPPNDYL